MNQAATSVSQLHQEAIANLPGRPLSPQPGGSPQTAVVDIRPRGATAPVNNTNVASPSQNRAMSPPAQGGIATIKYALT